MPMSVAWVAASLKDTLPATSPDTSVERSMASEPTSMTASTTSTMMRDAPLWRCAAGHWDTLQTTFLSGAIEAYT